jgi:DNA-binding SARP family transcriptional activator
LAFTIAAPGARADHKTRVRVQLLEGFELNVDGCPVDTPLGEQRLIAFLALHRHPLNRNYVAGSLWLDKTDSRATSNLRCALWRTHGFCQRLIESSRTHMRLAEDVYVDVAEVDAIARRLLLGELDATAVNAQLLGGELLPDWYDDWVLVERERLRQLCLNALDHLSASWLVLGKPALAVDAAYLAVAAEPLRETAHMALVEAHLAAGNTNEAVRQYTHYRNLLEDSLGIAPSRPFTQLIASVTQIGKIIRPATANSETTFPGSYHD